MIAADERGLPPVALGSTGAEPTYYNGSSQAYPDSECVNRNFWPGRPPPPLGHQIET